MSEFHNVKPTGRQQRKEANDHHQFEKDRLANRREGFQRHDPNRNILYTPEHAAGFQDDLTRFHSDYTLEEKLQRDKTYDNKQKIYDKIRHERIEREETKKQENLAIQERDEHRGRKKTDTHANDSLADYDIINLKGRNAEVDKFREDVFYYNGAMRAHKLYSLNNSKFNPITGEQTEIPITIPERPVPPKTATDVYRK